MSEDGTPLGVYARVGISFDQDSFAAVQGAQIAKRLREAIASGRAHAQLSVDFDGEEIRFDDPDIGFVGETGLGGDSSEGIGDFGGPVFALANANARPTDASLAGADMSADIQRQADEAKKAEGSGTGAPAAGSVAHRAVVAMRSKALDAEQRFRAVVVSLDSVPGNQVEGISPLYHVMGVDTADAEAAVIQLTTKLTPSGLAELLDSLSATHEGAVSLRLIDMEGESEGNDAETATGPQLPLQQAKREAEVLAPWLDMDPDARFDGDPVSFLLAMASDAARVGLLSDSWILGDTQ
ncbi:hypothetical protein [Bifidobacterium sp. ESL0790]|uniref:hypothetical protein n=1 Tax=Bifidobacterium sp. ESL0790 TaxID=2983233 RepID=UPI0023F9DAC1|nr:hypothetical protein [Bifidobacterium sp. ESL0790]WEV72011.1 hypothetical protein OZY47_06070 [Bifidobacterium sp. ESL0790]